MYLADIALRFALDSAKILRALKSFNYTLEKKTKVLNYGIRVQNNISRDSHQISQLYLPGNKLHSFLGNKFFHNAPDFMLKELVKKSSLVTFIIQFMRGCSLRFLHTRSEKLDIYYPLCH